MASLFKPGFSAPQHPLPPRRADDVELMADPASRQQVVVDIHDVEGPVPKSNGRTIVPADPHYLDFLAAMIFCFKSVIKILFVIVAVITSIMFIQTVATVTWIEKLAVLPVGVLLVVMFFMAYALCVAPVLSTPLFHKGESSDVDTRIK